MSVHISALAPHLDSVSAPAQHDELRGAWGLHLLLIRMPYGNLSWNSKSMIVFDMEQNPA